MCPACMATALLIASAVSTGGATAVLVTKFRAKKTWGWSGARKVYKAGNKKERTWAQRTSK
jgi:hypothetical protein